MIRQFWHGRVHFFDDLSEKNELVFDGNQREVNSVAMARQTAHVLATGGDEGIVTDGDAVSVDLQKLSPDL